MPRTGLEPARAFAHEDLNLARRPVPPPRLVKRNIESKSGWPDSNRRPPSPQLGALPDCATARKSEWLRCQSSRIGMSIISIGNGPGRIRTAGLRHARAALFQLSYRPEVVGLSRQPTGMPDVGICRQGCGGTPARSCRAGVPGKTTGAASPAAYVGRRSRRSGVEEGLSPCGPRIGELALPPPGFMDRNQLVHAPRRRVCSDSGGRIRTV